MPATFDLPLIARNTFYRPGGALVQFVEDLREGCWCHEPHRFQWRVVALPTAAEVEAVCQRLGIPARRLRDETMTIVQAQPHLEGILNWAGAFLRMRWMGE